jgi:hypothetical protein
LRLAERGGRKENARITRIPSHLPTRRRVIAVPSSPRRTIPGVEITAIFYPDCEATSDGGRFGWEARSPHNGTIPHRDGRPASEAEFGFKYREHQSEFRYGTARRVPL